MAHQTIKLKHILFLFVLSSLSSCYYDVEEELYPENYANCDSVTISFSNTILPLLDPACNTSGCHNSNDAASGIILDIHSEVIKYVNNGSLIGTMDFKNGFVPMPLNQNQLDDCTLGKVRNWINEGANDN